MNYELPKLLDAQVISREGKLIVFEESKNVPFEIKRVFYLSDVPSDRIRGLHAHKKTKQILICLQGEIAFYGENPDGEKFSYTLKNPNQAIYIPPHFWHEMLYQPNTTQLVFASTLYEESDYLRSKKEFIEFYSSTKK